MIEETPLDLPSDNEWDRRKKILEKNFVENSCPRNDLDPDKALYAIKEGILILEPAWIDWESDDYPVGSIGFAPGFDMSCLKKDSDKIKLPERSWWQKVKSHLKMNCMRKKF